MEQSTLIATCRAGSRYAPLVVQGWAKELPELRAGDLCPVCGIHNIDYNGLLNLACPTCGEIFGGGGFS